MYFLSWGCLASTDRTFHIVDQPQTHKYSSDWVIELGGLRSHVNICLYLNSVWIVGSSAKQYKQITEQSGHYNVDSPVLKPTWFYSRVKLWL